METSEWDYLDTALKDDDETDVAWPKTPADFVDQLGFKVAVSVLCVALFLAALWVLLSPSFQKCSAIEDVAQRNACYSELRNDELLKPRPRVCRGTGMSNRPTIAL
jgi:hypothetical protein